MDGTRKKPQLDINPSDVKGTIKEHGIKNGKIILKKSSIFFLKRRPIRKRITDVIIKEYNVIIEIEILDTKKYFKCPVMIVYYTVIKQFI